LGEGALPSFSLDDKMITFCQYRENQGVWVMNADGSGRKLIDAEGWCPDWAAGKDEIVYTTNTEEGANLRVTNIRTGATRLLLAHSKYTQIYYGLATSHDGQWVCFKGALPDGGSEIAIVSTVGEKHEAKVLLPHPKMPDVERFHQYANWTPDGKHVTALLHLKNIDNDQIYLLDVEGDAAPQRLEPQDAAVDQDISSFSPDGKKLLTIRQWEKPKTKNP
jgi:Tol biopolymer transport system component